MKNWIRNEAANMREEHEGNVITISEEAIKTRDGLFASIFVACLLGMCLVIMTVNNYKNMGRYERAAAELETARRPAPSFHNHGEGI